jgi:sugar O-acyltransferase (sialic acid O-acetyltransferase NeuD family)
METLNILGHGNVALSIILDIIVQTGKPFPDIRIFRNLPTSDNPEDKLPYLSEKLNILEHNHEKLNDKKNGQFIIGAFQPRAKNIIYQWFLDHYRISEEKYASVIHPTNAIANTVKLNKGIVAGPGLSIAPFTIIESFVSINRNVSIGHHTRIGKNTTINPGVNIAGIVNIGENVLIGMGSNIIDRITVGDNTIIGAGSLVNKSLPSNVLAYGVPAKVIKEI